MTIKYIVKDEAVVPLTQRADGFFYDDKGTIWARRNDKLSVDKVDRCGVGFFSLPEAWDINAACRAHDFAFSSDVYQEFHTFEDANKMLQQNLTALHYPITGYIFRKLSSWFGGKFWENKKTLN